MTFNTILNKGTFLTTLPPFNGNMFELWKYIFKLFIQSLDFKLWETIINKLFIPTHQVNEKVVEKKKFEIDFRTKNFLVVYLDDNELFYVNSCNSAK